MVSMKLSIKIIKFMAPGLGVQARGWGQYVFFISKYWENYPNGNNFPMPSPCFVKFMIP